MKFASDYDSTSVIAIAIAGAIAGSIGLILNTLNIYVILKSKKMKNNVIAPLQCALAFCDITFCRTLIPIVLQLYNNEPYQEESFMIKKIIIVVVCRVADNIINMIPQFSSK